MVNSVENVNSTFGHLNFGNSQISKRQFALPGKFRLIKYLPVPLWTPVLRSKVFHFERQAKIRLDGVHGKTCMAVTA